MRQLEDILFNVTDDPLSFTSHDLDIDSDDLRAQIKMKQLENDRYRSDTNDRKWLAIWTAGVVSIWLLLVIIILVENERSRLCLSDSVIIALLGTTTLNVLGLSFIVLKGHFQSSQTSA